MTLKRALLVLLSGLLICESGFARQDAGNPGVADEWKKLFSQVYLLEGSTALLPSLLPFIIRNEDALQLTGDQIRMFRQWRKDHYSNMVNVMNEIIALKVQFRSESMFPRVSRQYLIDIQEQIHVLQRQLLELRLSCRELVMTTFTEDQWSNFAFVASDHPRYSSLLMQHNAIYPYLSYEEWLVRKASEFAPASGATTGEKSE